MASRNGIKKRLEVDQVAALKAAILDKYKHRVVPKKHGTLVVAINKKVLVKDEGYKPLTFWQRHILREKNVPKEITSKSLVESVLGIGWVVEGYDIPVIMK
jgi:hypothetical protein